MHQNEPLSLLMQFFLILQICRYDPVFLILQICRYDPVTGVLITDPRLAGFRSEYNPILNPTEYYSNDQLPFENCCTKSDHCTLFRDYRPVESCYDPVLYIPPQLCELSSHTLLLLSNILYAV